MSIFMMNFNKINDENLMRIKEIRFYAIYTYNSIIDLYKLSKRDSFKEIILYYQYKINKKIKFICDM